MLISVVVPIYKTEKYLQQCVDSILNQTYKELEIILVNDGSPDNCHAICNEYALKDCRIKVIHKENGGLISSRKAGVEIAKGEYIGFVDSDDWIENNMYERLIEPIKNFQSEIISVKNILEFEYGQIKEHVEKDNTGLYNKEKIREFIIPKMLWNGKLGGRDFNISLCNKLFKKEIIKNGIKNINNSIEMGEDLAICINCMFLTKKFYMFESEFLYHHRQTNVSMSRSYNEDYFTKVMILFNTLKSCIIGNNAFKSIPFIDAILCHYILEIIRNEFYKGNIKKTTEKIKFLKNLLNVYDVKKAINSTNASQFSAKDKLIKKLFQNNSYYLITFLLPLLDIRMILQIHRFKK